MTVGHQSPPIINKQKSYNTHRQQMPTETAWLTTFKRILKTPNTRYALLWLTGGILFSVFGKRTLQRRDEELMIKDIETYLENKRKNDLK